MRIDRHRLRLDHFDRGQGMTEFLILTLFIAVVLLTPVHEGRSVSALLLASIVGRINAFNTWLAVI